MGKELKETEQGLGAEETGLGCTRVMARPRAALSNTRCAAEPCNAPPPPPGFLLGLSAYRRPTACTMRPAMRLARANVM